jgi:trans-AT polyketide synthase/acyltransferase/oxidoreductase domain-containing protein
MESPLTHEEEPPLRVTPEMLGSAEFLRDNGVKYAYVAGAMVKAIASAELVIRMGRARLLSYFGSGGLRLEAVEAAVVKIRGALASDEPFGVNLLHNILLPELEEKTVEIFFRHGVRHVEAAAFIHIPPALAWYRLRGLRRAASGEVFAPNRVLGKASRPEVAQQFLAPVPPELVGALRDAGKITREEAELAPFVPVADDLCAEADSAGHTDRRVAYALLPAFLRLRDEETRRHGYARPVRIGTGGGLGTPEAVAAAFMLGADFVLTGSINQCTVEAGTSDLVKELLAAADIFDTDITPAGDMFEIGAKVQVLKRGVLFPSRANKLYDLYRRYDSLEQIDPATRAMIEQKYFRRSFDDVWAETKRFYAGVAPAEVEKAEQNPKQKMAMIFRWYFVHTNRLALDGKTDDKLDFQIHCGPAMGAFNQWVKGTPYADWRKRHVDEIARLLMEGAARVVESRYAELARRAAVRPSAAHT